MDLGDPSWPSGTQARVHYDYYPNGAKQKETRYDRNGAELTYTAYEYDEQGRLTKVTQPVSGGTTAVTQIAYRGPGQAPFSGGLDTGASAKRITDAEGKATLQVFDAAGRLLKIHHPDGQVEEKEYWEDGSLKSQTVYEASGNGPGQKLTFEYDAEGRLQYKIYPGGSIGSMPRQKCIEFQYDGLGRRTAVIDYRESAHRMGGSNQMGWSYDALGRVKTATLHNGRVLTYSYSATGQRTGVTIQHAGQTEYNVSYTYAHTSGDSTTWTYNLSTQVNLRPHERGQHRARVLARAEPTPTPTRAGTAPTRFRK